MTVFVLEPVAVAVAVRVKVPVADDVLVEDLVLVPVAVAMDVSVSVPVDEEVDELVAVDDFVDAEVTELA